METLEPREREWFENVQPTGDKLSDAILLLLILLTMVAKILLLFARPVPTFRCGDGTLSYSSNSRGACSWHDGIDKRF